MIRNLPALLCCIYFLGCTDSLAAQGVRFIHSNNWDSVKREAAAQDKNIFVDISTTWCGPCKLMDKYVFTNDRVAATMNGLFINLHLDGEKGLGLLMAKKFFVSGYPTMLIFNKEGILIQRSIGGREAPSLFLEQLREWMKPSNLFLAKGFSENMQPAFPAFYVNSYEKQQVVDSASFARYMSTQDNWFSAVNWPVLARFGNFLPGYRLWSLRHADTLYSLYGVRIEGSAWDIVNEKFHLAALNKSRDEYLAAVYLMDSLSSVSKDSMARQRAMLAKWDYYGSTAQWDSLTQDVETVQHSCGDRFNNNAALVIMKHTSNRNCLRQALQWLCPLAEGREFLMLGNKAEIFYRLGEKDSVQETVKNILSRHRRLPDDNMFSAVVTQLFYQALEYSDLSLYQEVVYLLDNAILSNKKELLAEYAAQFYCNAKDWTNLVPVMTDYMNLPGEKNIRLITDICIKVYKDANDRNCIQKAIGWITPYLYTEPVPAHLQVYAELLYRSGRYAEAKKMAGKVMALSRKEILNVEDTKALLKRIHKKKISGIY